MTKRVIELVKLPIEELAQKILFFQNESIMLLKPYVNKHPTVIPEKIMIIYREITAEYINYSFAYLHKKISAVEGDVFGLKVHAKNNQGENCYAALYSKKDFLSLLNTDDGARTGNLSYMQSANPRINMAIFMASQGFIPYLKDREGFPIDITINKRKSVRAIHGDSSISSSFRTRFQEVVQTRKNYSANIILINRALEEHPQMGSINYAIGTIVCPVEGLETLTIQEFDDFCSRFNSVD